jgi:signal recognition particle subunit SRP54
MFDALTEKLGGVFDSLTGRGALSEKDVDVALREIRVALLEADVALPVAKRFVDSVRQEAVGEAVLRSVKPGQQVVKIVHDALVEMLGGAGNAIGLNLSTEPPTVVMMAGLQGSGKTTTTAKIALRLRKLERKRVLVASLDTRRPAAMEQLRVLAEQAEVDFLPIVAGQSAVEIAKRALATAKLSGFDVLILDTAGRASIDEALMAEAAEIAALAKPFETLLVADALTGQDAVETAKRFHERLPLTGIVLTRLDGDGRGGAALSMRSITGLPIKFAGVSEKIDGLEAFDPQRVAGRILGRGDIVALVEKAAADFDQEKAERMAKKLAKGQFDLDDLADQLRQIQKLGGIGGVMGMLPGVAKAKKQMEAANLNEKMVNRQVAIITSMTKAERKKPDLLNASRRRRIAAGAGVDVAEVNKVLKMHRQMADMMKAVGKGGKGLGGMMQALGMPQQGGFRTPPGLAQAMKDSEAGKNPDLPGLPKGLGGAGAPPNFPGLPGLPTKKH